MGRALTITLRRFDALGVDVEEWDVLIEKLVEKIPAVKTLRERMPGVGRVLAPVVVAESGPLERFHSHKAYGKYAGITPSDRSTGGRTIHGSITREGSRYLRWALTQGVIHCLHSSRDPGSGPKGAIARWVDAKQERTAGRAKVRVAAARKLATAIWWLFNDPKSFDIYKAFSPGTLAQEG
jgi:transposase